MSNPTPDNDLIAMSPSMQKVLKNALSAAKSQANIFIHGASGTGKEMLAKYIHQNSPRKTAPFIKVNCAAIPDTLIESEFFGHEKGSFTGAIKTRLGRFELADKGTLLLDEISEVSMSIQPKLLRAIQEGEFERLGAMISRKVDVRFISTSNRDMEKAIELQQFREDLYYRLNVVPLYIPKLKDRKEDIIPLAEHFLKASLIRNNKPLKELSDHAKTDLLNYSWPGNIRELANIIERTVIMEESSIIEEIPSLTKEKKTQSAQTLQEIEKLYILKTLQECANNKSHAAKILDISVKTLRSKLKSFTD